MAMHLGTPLAKTTGDISALMSRVELQVTDVIIFPFAAVICQLTMVMICASSRAPGSPRGESAAPSLLSRVLGHTENRSQLALA